jgi:(E)-4-hydroxy-3-methylbut-2-enyl-diphosphate synthase
VKVVDMAKEKHIPIRIGINAGSLPMEILDRYGGHPTAEGMVEGAMTHVKILEEEGFHDIVISVKSTDVPMMVKANRLLHEKVNYPLHLGVTEAGTLYRGTIKSAIGIGSLLLDGIGDTIRVSLTDDPLKEVKAAKEILSSVGIAQYGPVLVSCPTCGRTQVDLIDMAREVEEKIQKFKKPIRVAVMGCAVNGPGEAREADFGIAGGKGSGLLFRKGKVIRSVPEAELIDALMEEIEKFENEGESL